MAANISLCRTLIKAVLLLLAGCYKNHLYVQQEWVDENFLASSHVGTPDPRSENPPVGQRLLIAWRFPPRLFEEQLTLCITVRLWDNTQQIFYQPVDKKWGSTTFFFSNEDPERDRCILTYLVEVITEQGEVIETWKHHFWTELIEIDKPKNQ